MHQIEIINSQEKHEVGPDLLNIIQTAALGSLESEGFTTKSEIDITLVDNMEIRQINLEQRKIDKPTDVLSFPMVDILEGHIEEDLGDYNLETNTLFLGDIMVSLEQAKSQSEEYGHSFEREVAFLITHGVFHLLGYDHQDAKSEEIMIKKQEEVLKKMGLSR